MNKTIDRERVFDLLSSYEAILTDFQKKAVEDHYAYDLSFGEIGEENNVSRAAINDTVKKAIAKMEEMEGKLHLVEKSKRLKEIASLSDEEAKKALNAFLEGK